MLIPVVGNHEEYRAEGSVLSHDKQAKGFNHFMGWSATDGFILLMLAQLTSLF